MAEIIVNLPKQDESQSVEVVSYVPGAAEGTVVIKDALANKNNSLFIHVMNNGSEADILVLAGNNYPNKILGEKTIKVPAGEVTTFSLEDESRFENRDGSVVVSFPEGFNGKIWATAKRAGMKPVEQ